MTRAFLIVLDSVGCGGAEDAAAYGDVGANTLLHIAQACAAGRGDRDGLRSGPLDLPVMNGMGLGHAVQASCGEDWPALVKGDPDGLWGYGVETALGKDTPSGHWEMAGARPDFAWGYFPDTDPCFPPELVASLVSEAGLPGILGNRHASGTAIIDVGGVEGGRAGRVSCRPRPDRQADLLHLRRQRLPDRRPRGAIRPGAAL
jgi:phosphopentomutase